MTALRAVAGAAVLAVSLLVGVGAGIASAAPGDFGSGTAKCGGRLVPADPRLDVQNPLGGVMYRWFLDQFCPSPPTGFTLG